MNPEQIKQAVKTFIEEGNTISNYPEVKYTQFEGLSILEVKSYIGEYFIEKEVEAEDRIEYNNFDRVYSDSMQHEQFKKAVENASKYQLAFLKRKMKQSISLRNSIIRMEWELQFLSFWEMNEDREYTLRLTLWEDRKTSKAITYTINQLVKTLANKQK